MRLELSCVVILLLQNIDIIQYTINATINPKIQCFAIYFDTIIFIFDKGVKLPVFYGVKKEKKWQLIFLNFIIVVILQV